MISCINNITDKGVLFTIFAVVILGMLFLDLKVFNKKTHVVGFREAALTSGLWILLALAFNVFVYFSLGSQKALEFFTGYLIEESLSVDNLFVFIIIFEYFVVPVRCQHRVLFWGILGAVIMRGIFIFSGTLLVSRFHAVMYIFGAFLIFTGVRMLFVKEKKVDPERNFFVRLMKKFLPVYEGYEEGAFFIQRDGKLFATLLFLALVVIETTDVVFALDSIPAIFAITTDPFIVYTSNIFAVLGLRSLYFLLARLMHKFEYLGAGVACVLVFVGAKMLVADFLKIPILVALGIIAAILTISIIASVVKPNDARSS